MLYDICIIGGGIVGVCTACELAKYKLHTILLEQETELSFGVSKSNSGIIHTGFQADSTTQKAQLAVRGNVLWGQLSERLQFPLRRCGELVVGGQTDRAALEAMQANGNRLGIPGMKIVDRTWIDQHEPALGPDIHWALLGESAGVVNPYEAIYALAENAEENGLVLRTREKVTRISKMTDGWTITTEQLSHFRSKIIINAAGLFADTISQLAGINCETIHPRKGEEFLLDRHVKGLAKRVIFPLPSAASKGILMIPTVDLNYMIGPTAEDTHDKTDLSTSPEGKKQVLSQIQRLVPAIKEPAIIASFSGLRPVTPSGDFHIAEDAPGFINLIGIQSPGLTAAPAIAEIVRDIIATREALVHKLDYVPGRPPFIRFRDLSDSEKHALIQKNPDYGDIVCRCEEVTRAEIREAIHRGARTLDGIKFRTRSQMGRCHGAFCTAKIMCLIQDELGYSPEEITKRGGSSFVATGSL